MSLMLLQGINFPMKRQKLSFTERTIAAWDFKVFRPNGLRLKIHQGLNFLLAGLATILIVSSKQFDSDFCSGFRAIADRWFFISLYAITSVIGVWGIETKKWMIRFITSVIVGTVYWMTSCLFFFSGEPSMSMVVLCFPAFVSWYIAWDYRIIPAHYHGLLYTSQR